MLDWLKRRSGHLVLGLIVIFLAAGLAASFPADIAFLMALDLGTWVEAAVAVYVAAQVTRIRPLITFFRARFVGSHRRSARQRRLPAALRKQPSNDDEPAPLLFAA